MIKLMQEFRFIYPDGDLFFDKAGEVAKQLRAKIPGLERKEPDLVQRSFMRPSDRLNLTYGYPISEIKCYAAARDDFPVLSAKYFGTTPLWALKFSDPQESKGGVIPQSNSTGPRRA
jgi:hypothetical protein